MIRFDPSLQLSRLVVMQGGHRAYDQTFHPGVNIIRSEGNSAGKSTIAELAFYALGGDLTEWKEEAALCDTTYAHVRLNGADVTIRRDINRASQQPASIFFGSFEAAESSDLNGWQRYPYRRYGDRES